MRKVAEEFGAERIVAHVLDNRAAVGVSVRLSKLFRRQIGEPFQQDRLQRSVPDCVDYRFMCEDRIARNRLPSGQHENRHPQCRGLHIDQREMLPKRLHPRTILITINSMLHSKLVAKLRRAVLVLSPFFLAGTIALAQPAVTAWNLLNDAFHDKNPIKKKQAIAAIGSIGPASESIKLLKEALHDDDASNLGGCAGTGKIPAVHPGVEGSARRRGWRSRFHRREGALGHGRPQRPGGDRRCSQWREKGRDRGGRGSQARRSSKASRPQGSGADGSERSLRRIAWPVQYRNLRGGTGVQRQRRSGRAHSRYHSARPGL